MKKHFLNFIEILIIYANSHRLKITFQNGQRKQEGIPAFLYEVYIDVIFDKDVSEMAERTQ
jgi:hypothetical protein